MLSIGALIFVAASGGLPPPECATSAQPVAAVARGLFESSGAFDESAGATEQWVGYMKPPQSAPPPTDTPPVQTAPEPAQPTPQESPPPPDQPAPSPVQPAPVQPAPIPPQPLPTQPSDAAEGGTTTPAPQGGGVSSGSQGSAPAQTGGSASAGGSTEGNTFPSPTPPRVRGSIDVAYPVIARERGVEGTVTVEAAIDADGRPISVKVIESSGHSMLDAAAENAVRSAQFVAATDGVNPIASQIDIVVSFRLENPS